MADQSVLLPNGDQFLTRVGYTGREATGVLVLIIFSTISGLAVVGLLTSIALSAWNTRKSVNPNMFVRSHAAAYLLSLLLCDLLQAIGSIMNAEWYMNMAVEFNHICVAQGAIKHVADVGTAIWSLIIAFHTFWILFLRMDTRRYILIATLVGGWSAIGAIVIAGPAALNVTKNGPFFAISGYWCWISEHYDVARVTLDYMFMFLSALFSFVLYAMILLRLRGNILVHGWCLQFRLHRSVDHPGGESADSQIITVAKQMLLYPVAYTVLILPIAACRFSEWAGHEVPFGVTIFSDCIFLLSGLVNVVLFSITRRVLPPHSVIPVRFSRKISANSNDTALSNSVTLVDDESIDLEKSTYPHTYNKFTEDQMFKSIDSPDDSDDDARSDISIPIQPIPLSPAPRRSLHNPHSLPGASSHFVHVPLSSASYNSRQSGSSEGSIPESPTMQFDYVVRSPLTAPGMSGGSGTVVRESVRYGTPQASSFRGSRYLG